ncbi:MAG: adenylate/guanylate cyclase domain-containing protein [Saprospiraceae bacterium]
MKFNKNTLLFLLAASLNWTSLFSQNDLLRVYNFGIEDGLSQRDVFKVQQGEDGFLWIMTKNGLDRYDGHQFLHWYKGDEKNYIPNGIQYDLMSGREGNIWFSRGEGLIQVNPKQGTLDSLSWPNNSEQPAWINLLCQDGLGRIWTTKYNPADSTSWLQRTDEYNLLQDIALLPGNYPKRPILSRNGLLYVGVFDNEIWVYDLDGKQVGQFEFPAPANQKSYSRVIQLQSDRKGYLWAMLDHGQIYYLSPNATSFTRHPISENAIDHFHSSAFLIDSKGDIWMGGLVTQHVGESGESPCTSYQPGALLLHYNSISNRLEDHSYFLKQALPYAEAPRQIYEDQTGVIWIATPFGLVRMVENNLFERYMADGNDCCRDGVCSMRGITEDDEGNIYFSYYSSIHVLNPKNGSLVPLFSKQLTTPYGILYDQGHIYTGEGLRINLRTLSTDTVAYGVAGAEGVVMKDSDRMLWFGSQHNLLIYNPTTSATTTYQDPKGIFEKTDFENITYLHPGKDGQTFWVATREKGILHISKKEGTLAHYHTSSDPALPHDRILAVHENNGSLWIATAAGLARLNLSNEQVEVFTTENGLPNDFINGLLLEGDSAVWVSTDNGLSRFDISKNSFSNFFYADGLSKNEFNRMSFHQSKDGRMYFGGINGINAFYPNARYGERKTKMNSRLLLSGFSKFGEGKDTHQASGIENGQPIVLTHLDETFTFHFSLGDFTDPKTHQYSYLLEGYSNEWSEPTSVQFARFVNIPAGKYVFRARASRGKGDWVKNELAIPVIIKQAFYRTAWFRLLALGLFSVLVYGVMRYRLHLVKKHEQELEKLVLERTRELETEKAKSDELLLNILPADTAEELKQFGSAKARRHDDVTVMFTDFKGFSFIARDLEPEALVAEIDHCFRAFDEIIEEFGLEKIKTVGDAYLCGGGLYDDDDRHAAVQVVRAALKIQEFLTQLAAERRAQDRPCFEARIGIHSGPVVAGIVGIKKFAYDIWGDTVNISERLQANGEVGKVNISKCTYELVKDHFTCTYRGKVAAKHSGEFDMYFVSSTV